MWLRRRRLRRLLLVLLMLLPMPPGRRFGRGAWLSRRLALQLRQVLRDDTHVMVPDGALSAANINTLLILPRLEQEKKVDFLARGRRSDNTPCDEQRRAEHCPSASLLARES